MRLLLIIMVMITIDCFGQCTNCLESQAGKFCWGSDRKITEERLAKFLDYLKMADAFGDKSYFDEGLVELTWLLDNVPCFHKSMYVQGQKFIETAIQKSGDEKSRKYFEKKLKHLIMLKEKYFPKT